MASICFAVSLAAIGMQEKSDQFETGCLCLFGSVWVDALAVVGFIEMMDKA